MQYDCAVARAPQHANMADCAQAAVRNPCCVAKEIYLSARALFYRHSCRWRQFSILETHKFSNTSPLLLRRTRAQLKTFASLGVYAGYVDSYLNAATIPDCVGIAREAWVAFFWILYLIARIAGTVCLYSNRDAYLAAGRRGTAAWGPRSSWLGRHGRKPASLSILPRLAARSQLHFTNKHPF